MASESPFTRHGRSVEGDRAPKRYQLTGSARENLLQISHREIGEWRDWRAIARANGMVDPVDAHGFEHDASPHFVVPFSRVDGPGQVDEDLTDELGPGLSLYSATPELSGTGWLIIEDIGPGEYQIRFQAPGDDMPGGPETIKESGFVDINGDAISQRVSLSSHRGRYRIDISFDIDAWLILWLMRETPLELSPTAARFELLIPEPQLDPGR